MNEFEKNIIEIKNKFNKLNKKVKIIIIIIFIFFLIGIMTPNNDINDSKTDTNIKNLVEKSNVYNSFLNINPYRNFDTIYIPYDASKKLILDKNIISYCGNIIASNWTFYTNDGMILIIDLDFEKILCDYISPEFLEFSKKREHEGYPKSNISKLEYISLNQKYIPKGYKFMTLNSMPSIHSADISKINLKSPYGEEWVKYETIRQDVKVLKLSEIKSIFDNEPFWVVENFKYEEIAMTGLNKIGDFTRFYCYTDKDFKDYYKNKPCVLEFAKGDIYVQLRGTGYEDHSNHLLELAKNIIKKMNYNI